jgi:hypothetical protein
LAQINAALQAGLSIDPELRMNNVEPYTLNLYQAEKELYDAVDVRNPDRLLVKMPSPQEAQDQTGVNMGGAQDLANIPYGG